MGFALILLIGFSAVVIYFVLRAERSKPHYPDPPRERAPPAKPSSRITDHVERALTVDLAYGDADGVVTERAVTVLAVEFDLDSGDAVKLEGWCHSREARRNFRPDRIIEMRNSQTGEKIANPKRYLAAWARRERDTQKRNRF